MRKQRAAAKQSLQEFNRTGVQFLITELDTAMTFLAVAEDSKNPEKVSRNHKNALTAYRTFLHLSKKVTPDPQEQRVMEEKLRLLKKRLKEAGLD